jgi:ribosomal protein S7
MNLEKKKMIVDKHQQTNLMKLNRKKIRKKVVLKNKIVNSFMKSGKKRIGEKILLKCVKFLQKSTNKNSINLLKLGIVNSTPIFKLNEQVVKKGKRKALKVTPAFITKNSLRVMIALKFINKIVSKNSSLFYKNFGDEIIASAHFKSPSVDKKNEFHKQVLMNKRYISKFRW